MIGWRIYIKSDMDSPQHFRDRRCGYADEVGSWFLVSQSGTEVLHGAVDKLGTHTRTRRYRLGWVCHYSCRVVVSRWRDDDGEEEVVSSVALEVKTVS